MKTKMTQKAEFQNKLGLSFVISMTIALMALIVSHETLAGNNTVKMAEATNAEIAEMQAPAASPQVQEEPIFLVVEEPPVFPGGEEGRLQFLRENVRYPKLALDKRIQGTVFVTFVIEKDGSISDVRVLRGIGGGCDEEAVRVVESFPRWTPGRQRGQPVRVQFTMPVRFALN